MKVIGITGSSGSGKTTVSEILGKRSDTKVINADKMAKVLSHSETEYFREVKEAFQEENILLEDGSLNRAKLANLIYHNKSNLEKLNRITFKHLIPQIIREIHKVPSSIKIVVIDAPLLFEADLEKYCDFTIALQAPINLKIERICKRDKVSIEVAKDRLEIQQTNEFYAEKADFVIENNKEKTEEKLAREINEIISTNLHNN